VSQQYPNITAGLRLTADVLNAMTPTWVIKPADTTRASTVTATSDPDLVTDTLTAGGVYYVKFVIRFAALTAAGLRTAWLVPSGTTGNKCVMGPGQTNAANATDAIVLDMRWAVHGYATNCLYTDPRNSTTNQTFVIEEALVSIGSTAGTIAMQWAQNVTNATGTIVNNNSYIMWQQIA
jgi:hypothetical protein